MASHRSALALALLLAPLIALPLGCPGAARAEERQLTILHTADLHGTLTAWDYLADRPAPRGLTRIATMVQRARRESSPLLLLDAGDAMQGSPLETIWRGGFTEGREPMMSAMSRMLYDAMAVGNHEFSYGLGAMARARADAGFPWLAANIVRGDGSPAFDRSRVWTFGDLRVGVVGISTEAVPSLEDSANIAGLRFLPAVAAVREEVARLRGEGQCDGVIVLAHTGLGRPAPAAGAGDGDGPTEDVGLRIAQEVPGIDLLILGHTHAVIDSMRVGGTVITQAGRWAEGLGRVDLTFTRFNLDAHPPGDPPGSKARPRWTLAGLRSRVLPVTDTIPTDPALDAMAEPYHRATVAALAETLGVAEREIAAPGGRLEDGPLWELIHRVQLDATRADVSLAALFDPAVRIAPGPVTLRDAMAVYPYDNTLVVVELTGAELEATLERSAGYFAARPYGFDAEAALVDSAVAGFNFDAAEGVGYEIDLTRPPGDRIQHLTWRGEPLGSEQRLRVAINSYRRNGGGGFEALRRAPRLPFEPRPVRDLLVSYIRRMRSLEGSFARNWTLVPDYVSTRERSAIDLLVRQGALPRGEAMRFYPSEPARRGDLAYWIARAFGWRERRLSGAYADVPDSLEPWLDGLVRRRALGVWGREERFQPFAVVSLSMALDLCEGSARAAGYAVAPGRGDTPFRRGLLTGIDFGRGPGRTGPFIFLDSLSRGQAIGLVANLRYPSVRVLATTDFHGAILPGRRNNRPVGGSAVLAAWIAALRAENPEGTVLVDGGDLFQGTMISNLAFGRPVVEQMNALGYTAAAIGNHEFDWSADTLERRVSEMQFAALGANMSQVRDGKRPRWARSDTLVTRKGVRIGILGLCYPETPTVTLAKYVAHLRFADDSATAAAIAPRLRSRDHADVVIGVGHIPGNADSTGRVTGDLGRLARGVAGVDAWFGGHSHNRINGRAERPIPTGRTHGRAREHVYGAADRIPAMIAGSHGEVISVVDLRVDPVAHRVVERRQRQVVTYGDRITPDSAMAARVERWNATVAAIGAEPVGRNTRRLTRARGAESTVGNLVSDAMRAAVGADVAFQNSGGLRADLPEGVVTRGGIYEVMPFDNTIVTMEMTGAEVRRVIEDGLRSGRVHQVSGLRFAFDLSRPAMDRVTSLQGMDGAPFDTTRTWKVAVNNFMADGGDDSSTLARGRNKQDTQVLVRDALERLVRERCAGGGALDYRTEGRITRSGGGD